MERRTFMKGLGAAGVAGAVGTVAMTGGAAAAGMNVSATDPSPLTNDDGAVKEVSIDPELTINWSDFDSAVGAVSIFVEAYVGQPGDADGPNGGYYPLHRSEPALLPGSYGGMTIPQPGTTGTLELGPISSLSGNNRADLDSWDKGRTGDGDLRVADAENGAPDYSGASEGYLQGANVYGATIPGTLGQGDLVNGEYGAASGTGVFEPGDGEDKRTRVSLRYTVQLLEFGLNHFEAVTGYDIVGETDGTVGGINDQLEELYNHTEGTWDASELNNAGWLSDVEPDDITVVAVPDAGGYSTDPSEPITWEVNQKRPAMSGPGEEYPAPGFAPTSRHAANMRGYGDNYDTPAVMHQEVAFGVDVTNEVSGSTSGGSSNTTVN